MTAHEQLVAALRVIIAECDNVQKVINHTIAAIAAEAPERMAQPLPVKHGPYAPNSWSRYADRGH